MSLPKRPTGDTPNVEVTQSLHSAGDQIHWQKQLGNKVIQFDELSKSEDEVLIEHTGQLYRLRKTRHGKLVLSK
ncbi:hemin uptake protein HemP [Neorhodopirellula lusitana]|uniref:hemin uptake protein HemP n=1 Tax=Neorhodopirellula lusitana TaxID=445327 RepID=UPI00384AF9C3